MAFQYRYNTKIQFVNRYLEQKFTDFVRAEFNEKTSKYENKVIFNDETKRVNNIEKLLNYQKVKNRGYLFNEMDSINEIAKEKIMIFHTSTLDPSMNMPLSIDNEKEMLSILRNQHNVFKKYFNSLLEYNSYKEIDYKHIKVFELTDNINMHNHKIDFLDKAEDFKSYIESIYLARNKTNIGRVELAIDRETFMEKIRPMFINGEIVVRINNIYTPLTLVENRSKLKDGTIKYNVSIRESVKDGVKSNKIYFRMIETMGEEDNKHITKYLYSYLLKSTEKDRFDLDPTKETLIFKELNIKAKSLSHNFFSKTNVEIYKPVMDTLYNGITAYEKYGSGTNYTGMFKGMNEDDIKEIVSNKNHLFYYVGKCLDEKKIIIDKSENQYRKQFTKDVLMFVKKTLGAYVIKRGKESYYKFIDDNFHNKELIVLPRRTRMNREKTLKVRQERILDLTEGYINYLVDNGEIITNNEKIIFVKEEYNERGEVIGVNEHILRERELGKITSMDFEDDFERNYYMWEFHKDADISFRYSIKLQIDLINSLNKKLGIELLEYNDVEIIDSEDYLSQNEKEYFENREYLETLSVGINEELHNKLNMKRYYKELSDKDKIEFIMNNDRDMLMEFMNVEQELIRLGVDKDEIESYMCVYYEEYTEKEFAKYIKKYYSDVIKKVKNSFEEEETEESSLMTYDDFIKIFDQNILDGLKWTHNT